MRNCGRRSSIAIIKILGLDGAATTVVSKSNVVMDCGGKTIELPGVKLPIFSQSFVDVDRKIVPEDTVVLLKLKSHCFVQLSSFTITTVILSRLGLAKADA